MLRKRIVSDETLVKLIVSAKKVEKKKQAGERPFKHLPAERITALKAAMDALDKQSPDEVLVFELADPVLRAERYAKLEPGKSNLPPEVQVQRMTGAYYFHLRIYILKELLIETGWRELEALHPGA